MGTLPHDVTVITVAPQSSPFEFILTNAQVSSLSQLSAVLTGASHGSVTECVQKVSFEFLSTPNEHIMQDRFSCSLIRFIIIVHLLLDGTFEPASTIVPNLSCLQFCICAAAAYEGYMRISNGDQLDDGLLG
jgi:hypothetical protein